MNLFGRKRDQEPAPDQNTDDQAVARYRYMLATAPPEDVEGIVSTDPGARQAQGQGRDTPEEQGTLPPEHPDAEPGFA